MGGTAARQLGVDRGWWPGSLRARRGTSYPQARSSTQGAKRPPTRPPPDPSRPATPAGLSGRVRPWTAGAPPLHRVRRGRIAKIPKNGSFAPFFGNCRPSKVARSTEQDVKVYMQNMLVFCSVSRQTCASRTGKNTGQFGRSAIPEEYADDQNRPTQPKLQPA